MFKRIWLSLALVCLLAWDGRQPANANPAPPPRYLIVFIGDGMGANHLQAANIFADSTPEYQGWTNTWMSTYSINGSYNPAIMWTDFNAPKQSPTDSAAAATALFSGTKTANNRLGVSADGGARLASIAEWARWSGRAVGAVSSVQLSHATPGAWLAHNDSRANSFAIADEALWGDPNTTGTPAIDARYAGGHGPSLPPPEVLISGGHPAWNSAAYLNQTMVDKLQGESNLPGAFTFVQRIDGSPDGGARLLAAASAITTTRLAGLFGGAGGNLEFRLANGAGASSENPTLAQMTLAALQVLQRDPDGFALMIEGGAIDWASHSNNMDQMLGEVFDFNAAIQTAIQWVEDLSTPSDWENTLFIVTADHETGYLTQSPGVFPNQPLGEVSDRTLNLEKTDSISGLRTSWEDDGDGKIETGEAVYWAWNSAQHTNSLVRLFAKGLGAETLTQIVRGTDPVRGSYLDNTDLFPVMRQALGYTHAVWLPVIIR
ncbi:MAG: alkaline phosphatase [Anaerolineales bacterium]|nr:alkaline phosphatase [Anaerolineales bacterium]